MVTLFLVSSFGSPEAASASSAPTVTLSPGSGASGDTVRVTGSGFGGYLEATVTFGGVAVTSAITSVQGKLVAEFSVPALSGPGSHTVKVRDSNGNSATSTFTVVAAAIELAPPTGPAGNTVRINGSDFAAFSSVGVTSGGTALTSATSGNDGSFRAAFAVPGSWVGGSTHAIVAKDSSGNTATAVFTVSSPAIALVPAAGLAGSSTVVNGSGFAEFSTVTVTFNGAAVTWSSSGAPGNFRAGFTIPSVPPGTYEVVATDALGHSASAQFTVKPGKTASSDPALGTPMITVAPSSGIPGFTSIVNGSGFAKFSEVTITYDGATVATATTQGSGGVFIAQFTVPVSSLGAHQVVATDSSGNSASGTFTVISAAIALESSSGPVGYALRVKGEGFSQLSTVTVTYDGTPVTSATTGGSGSFSAIFNVPPSSGANTVAATDSNGHSATGPFTVLTPTITVMPNWGVVGTLAFVTGSGFLPFSTITVTFHDTFVAVATTGGLGAFATSFVVPASSVGPNTIKSVDPLGDSATTTFEVAIGPGAIATSSTSISCTPSTIPAGSPTSCTATVADSSGFGRQPTPTGSIIFYSDGSGAFTSPGNPCPLAGSGASASCTVTYTPASDFGGVQNITAVYSGDSTYEGSSSSPFALGVIAFSIEVACTSSSVNVGASTTCTASVSPSGLSGRVTFATVNNDALPSPRTCALSSGSCSVSVFGSKTGSDSLSATYYGQSASTPLSVGVASNTVAYGSVTEPMEGGDATFTSIGSTGINVTITGSTAPDGTPATVVAQDLSAPDVGVSVSTLGSSEYYDVLIVGISDGTAQVCIQEPSAGPTTVMQYWGGTSWVSATEVSVQGGTVCGDIPVSSLTGTNLVLGTSSGGGGGGGIGGGGGLGGIVAPQAVILTLVAEKGEANLSASNGFEITFVAGGQTKTITSSGGSVKFGADIGSVVTIAGKSSGSGSSEEWVLDAAGAPVSTTLPFPFLGTTVLLTYYYYDLLGQTVSFDILGGGSPQAVLNYSTAPASAGPSDSPTTASTTVAGVGLELWARNGSTAFAAGVVAGGQGERWVAAPGARSWTIDQANAIASPLTYFHQYSQLVSYSTSDGSVLPSGSPMSYVFEGASATATLTTSPQVLWMDAGSIATAPTTSLTGGTQRWLGPSLTQQIVAPNVIASPLAFLHQFLLSVTGASIQPQWFNSGATAVVTTPGVYSRDQGSGMRVASYSVDGGIPLLLAPTLGNVSVSILMTEAHALSFNSVAQYQLVLDSSALQALQSVTPPTIGGDAYWYDSGTPVSVTLQGAWGRTSGSGERLASFAVSGGAPTTVATTGLVTALSLASISASESLVATVQQQYQLTLAGGQVVSVTPPTIPGDAGWYDSGTAVQAVFSYAWNTVADQSRLSAVSYTVDSGPANALQRSGSGTFAVSVTMGEPNTVGVGSVTQYYLAVTGGAGVSESVASPTHDAFYDSGSTVSVSSSSYWNVQGETRQGLASYTLNGVTTAVTPSSSGTFTTPGITLNQAEELAFNSAYQYLVSISFKDISGTHSVKPTSFDIEAAGVSQPAQGSEVWMNSGTSFQVSNVEWEGTNVTPPSETAYTVTGPLTASLDLQVLAPSVLVSDYLGDSVPGATVRLTLANGTSFVRTTGANGSVTLPLVPAGNFVAAVDSLGLTTHASGGAAGAGVVHAKVLLSYPTLATMFVVIAAIGMGMFVLRRRVLF